MFSLVICYGLFIEGRILLILYLGWPFVFVIIILEIVVNLHIVFRL